MATTTGHTLKAFDEDLERTHFEAAGLAGVARREHRVSDAEAGEIERAGQDHPERRVGDVDRLGQLDGEPGAPFDLPELGGQLWPIGAAADRTAA